ncbi:dihydroorotate dehydrogenase-like protein [Synechococcus elongatus]|uniref:Dihydroorotate dehydrogenase-like protein n=1 Tax=Synechococcus elongatus PCC 11802 TaxID=2283154 RepID=A0AAT9JTU0_SYNEL|nr:dihydroorotate dehydrogenase-like protein [Synechococcus elongatus]QFZ91913.1 dihydroorotate dehydrogenase-like protein [Synechococcus elongatus PCC 11802]
MDLSMDYLGLKLRSPLVVGAAAPLSERTEQLPALEAAGASAIVLHSLFEEQVEAEHQAVWQHLEVGSHHYAESLTYAPEPAWFPVGPIHYLRQIEQAKRQVQIPIIASLNGTSDSGWVDYARRIEDAGADALELNLYALPVDPDRSGAEVEAQYLRVVEQVRAATQLPLAVKLSPFFSSPGHMARQFAQAGAQALVLFNRFYQPDIDIESLEVVPRLILSNPQDQRLPLHWIALLYGQVAVDFAATGGVQRADDVIRMVMAGAATTQIVGAILRHGPDVLTRIESDLQTWLAEHDCPSLALLQGCMSQQSCPAPDRFERVQYLRSLQSGTWAVPEVFVGG